jgi:3-oxo-5alpha-steroid 4-dehydrogenase
MSAAPSSLPLESVEGWSRTCDVLVVGHGGAGAAAAIEAARAGADTLVLERMTRGGGAAQSPARALSSFAGQVPSMTSQ